MSDTPAAPKCPECGIKGLRTSFLTIVLKPPRGRSLVQCSFFAVNVVISMASLRKELMPMFTIFHAVPSGYRGENRI